MLRGAEDAPHLVCAAEDAQGGTRKAAQASFQGWGQFLKRWKRETSKLGAPGDTNVKNTTTQIYILMLKNSRKKNPRKKLYNQVCPSDHR